MRKLIFVVGVFLAVTGFTKQEITSKVDASVFENFKTEITELRTQQDPWVIFTAIDNNDYAGVKSLLAQGIKANKRDWANNTPLMWAAKRGYTNICELLLSYYTKDMNIDEPNDYDWTALMFAAQNNRAETAKFLIEKGANKNYRTSSFSETIMGVAATSGAVEVIKVLLNKGVSIEQKSGNLGYTPLMNAVDANKAGAVSFLIAKKAAVNAEDSFGDTPLMIAASKGYYRILQILIANSAKVNIENEEGKTALIFAAENGHYDSVAYMLDTSRLEKANINHKDIYGKTALKYARENGHAKVAELLVSKGAK